MVFVGDTARTVDSLMRAGAVYVFAKSGSGWSQTQKITAGDPSMYAYFGSAIAVEGNTLMIGARRATTDGGSCGGVYVVQQHRGYLVPGDEADGE